MSWIDLLFLLGGSLIGYAIGRLARFNTDTDVRDATNLVIASFAITADSNYGEEWRHEFFDEVKSAMESEKMDIALLAAYMGKVQSGDFE